jgi:hypothetical protein
MRLVFPMEMKRMKTDMRYFCEAQMNIDSLFALVRPILYLCANGYGHIAEQLIADASGLGINPRWLDLVNEVQQ